MVNAGEVFPRADLEMKFMYSRLHTADAESTTSATLA